jgi:phage gp36-like protein
MILVKYCCAIQFIEVKPWRICHAKKEKDQTKLHFIEEGKPKAPSFLCSIS